MTDEVEQKGPPEGELASPDVRHGHIGRALPISEVREDMVICQHGTHYAEVKRSDLIGDDEPLPGHRVLFMADGRCVLGGRLPQPAASETTRLVPREPEPDDQ